MTDVVEATAATDLAALASALANFRLFEGGVGVTELQRNNVVQARVEEGQPDRHTDIYTDLYIQADMLQT